MEERLLFAPLWGALGAELHPTGQCPDGRHVGLIRMSSSTVTTNGPGSRHGAFKSIRTSNVPQQLHVQSSPLTARQVK